MGDRATLAKARRELEELYLGVPDDSVNLTFQDFAEVSQNAMPTSETKKTASSHPVKKMETIPESSPKRDHFPSPTIITNSRLDKLPSLDFSRGLGASPYPHRNHDISMDSAAAGNYHHHHHHHVDEPYRAKRGNHEYNHGHYPMNSHGRGYHGHHGTENSMAYDDMSGMNMTSMYQEKGGRRRPGIPHSNICTICSVYIYVFRNRCLVCGRVYCRQCVNIGMGEMTEGRKCIDCLGRKFSQRYIHKAGSVGCWSSCFQGYPSGVKMQELKWAEKGPRRTGDNRYNRSVMMMSRSSSPMGPRRTPTRTHVVTPGPPSFVSATDYSPYATPTPTHHHLPL